MTPANDNIEPFIQEHTIYTEVRLDQNGRIGLHVMIMPAESDGVGLARERISEIQQSETHAADTDLFSQVTNEVDIDLFSVAEDCLERVASMHAVEHIRNLMLSEPEEQIASYILSAIWQLVRSERDTVRFVVCKEPSSPTVVFVHADPGHLPLDHDHFDYEARQVANDMSLFSFVAPLSKDECIAIIADAAALHGIEAGELLMKCRGARARAGVAYHA